MEDTIMADLKHNLASFHSSAHMVPTPTGRCSKVEGLRCRAQDLPESERDAALKNGPEIWPRSAVAGSAVPI